MSTDEYVPDEEDVRNAYALEGARDTIGDLCHRDIPVARAEFDRFLARVKRDAAREALDGLAREVRRLIPEADPAQQDRMKYAAGLITAEAMNYPEQETP